MPGFTLSSMVEMGKSKFKTFDEVKTSFAGKTVLVTGANAGLGLEVAHLLASLNVDRLVLAVRSLDKGKAAAAEIEAKANKPELCHVMELDMARFESVTKFVENVQKEVPLLDTAILNAGVRTYDYEESVYGFEMDVQVNALSTTLLALLLIPHLKQTSEKRSADAGSYVPAHMTLVTSSSHKYIYKSELPAPDSKDGLVRGISNAPKLDKSQAEAQLRYGKSKLIIMWMMSRLARIGAGDDVEHPAVIVDSVCPGACRSTLARGMDSLPERIFVAVFSFFFLKSTATGANIIVKAATLGPEAIGKWWYENELTTPAPLVSSKEGQELASKAWKETIDILEAKVPEVGQFKDVVPI